MGPHPSTIPISPVLPAATQRTAAQVAQALGKLLFDTPEHQAYQQALDEVNRDADVQQPSARICERTIVLRCGKGDAPVQQTALTTLEARLAQRQWLHAYRHADWSPVPRRGRSHRRGRRGSLYPECQAIQLARQGDLEAIYRIMRDGIAKKVEAALRFRCGLPGGREA